MADKKVNINKVLSTISDSNNGELFDALIAGDIERAGNNAETAAKTVIGRLSWYLAGDKEAVADVFASTALADKVNNPGALIVKACESLKSTYSKSASFFGEDAEEERPARGRRGDDGDKKPKLGIADVEQWLADNNVTVRFNRMSGEVEYSGLEQYAAENITDNLPTIIYNDVKDDFSTCNSTVIREYLKVISSITTNQYHPALDYINSLPAWDGKDRFPELWAMMHIDTPTDDNKLSQTLVKKWMRQSVAILHNGEQGKYFGLQGVLTIYGEQGTGKTTLLRCLAGGYDYFAESQRIDASDKDTSRRCLQKWIVELGELDCTFKSDIAYIKGFITRQVDEYRLPYAASDVRRPRLSSLAATVNGDQFLVDPTGNRRFWTVPVPAEMKNSIEALNAYDFGLLWAQTIAEINADGKPWATCFLLSPAEEAALAVRNNGVAKKAKGEDEIYDILLTGGDKSTWEWQTVSKFRTNFIDILRSYSADQLGRILHGMDDVEFKRKRINGTVVKAYLLPGSSVSYLPTMDTDPADKAPNYGEYNNNNDDEDIPF